MDRLSSIIDHTLLKPDFTRNQIIKLCKEAVDHKFASVCVPPSAVQLAKDQVKHSEVLVCTVIGFPLGYTTTAAKLFETSHAIDQGADEIDMVMNVSNAKSGDYHALQEDIEAVYSVCQQFNRVLKVIIETALLNDTEKRKVCDICATIGVDFVKTSTGFSSSGATLADVRLMRSCLPKEIKIKASGGIRTGEFARALVDAGANRLGCSSSIDVINS